MFITSRRRRLDVPGEVNLPSEIPLTTPALLGGPTVFPGDTPIVSDVNAPFEVLVDIGPVSTDFQVVATGTSTTSWDARGRSPGRSSDPLRTSSGQMSISR